MPFALENPEAEIDKSKSKHVCLGSSCLESAVLIADQTLTNVTWQIISWPQAPCLLKQIARLHYNPNGVRVT